MVDIELDAEAQEEHIQFDKCGSLDSDKKSSLNQNQSPEQVQKTHTFVDQTNFSYFPSQNQPVEPKVIKKEKI